MLDAVMAIEINPNFYEVGERLSLTSDRILCLVSMRPMPPWPFD